MHMENRDKKKDDFALPINLKDSFIQNKIIKPHVKIWYYIYSEPDLTNTSFKTTNI